MTCRKQYIVILFFIFLWIGNYAVAQEQKTYYFSANWGVGQAVNNYVNFPQLPKTAQILELHFGEDLNGSEPWHFSYNLPHRGVSLIYSSLGNPDVLGNMYGLSYEFDADYILGVSSSLRVGIGVGSAYLDRPYDEVDNAENIINGASFTAMFKARLFYQYRFSPHITVFGGGTFFHTSNSHTQLPNVGMNMPYVSLGFRYSKAEKEKNAIVDNREMANRRLRWGMRAAFGFNEHGGTLEAVGGPKYPIYLLSVSARRNYRYTRKYTVGIDLWYNCGVKSFIRSQDYFDNNYDLYSSVAALTAGHEFLMNRFSFVVQTGVYLYNPYYRKRWRDSNEKTFHQYIKTLIPGRIGLLYYFKSPVTDDSFNIYTGAFIKSNLGQADFLETTVGIEF